MTLNNRWRKGGMVLVLLAAGITVAVAAERNDDIPEMFGGDDAVEVVRSPETVRAYRLAASRYQKSLDDYTMKGDPVAVPATEAKALAELLVSRDSYMWDVAKGCLPIYGVRLQFVDGEETVDVLFCFQCDVLAVYHNGRAVGGEDFDKIRGRLLKVIKPLFPEDEVIQSLEK